MNDTLAVAKELPRFGVPARFVWGVANQFQKVQFGERLARDLGAALRRIESGKHFTPEDHPGVVAEEITSTWSWCLADDSQRCAYVRHRRTYKVVAQASAR